jgi:quinol monooxygenase YgiN
MSKIFLFVDIDVKAGQRVPFLDKLNNHAKTVRSEPGCEKLDIYIDTEHPDKVCVWEIWTSREHFDVHMKCDTTMAWRPVAAPFVNGEKITVMNPA